MPHQRTRSGHGLPTSTSSADVGGLAASRHKRPAFTRRHTPVNAQKLGRSPREREREWHESWDAQRESFPQYCMTCEKQFVPRPDTLIYCSDACRQQDQNPPPHDLSPVPAYLNSSYAISSEQAWGEPKDIVPRASPSRPNSMLFNTSPPNSPGTMPSSPPYSSALSALRSLSLRPPSPPSPAGGGLWPFSRSAAHSPGNSYTRPSPAYLSTTYDAAGISGGVSYSGGGDRPAPRLQSSSTSRPRSVELITPLTSR